MQSVTAPMMQGDATDSQRVKTGSAKAKGRRRRRKTDHLKLVPECRRDREQLRASVSRQLQLLNHLRPLTQDELEGIARRVLAEEGLPECYVGWTMVLVVSEFWRDQVAAIPRSRRILLLPTGIVHSEACPARPKELDPTCPTCVACRIAEFGTLAKDLGYQVLVTDGFGEVLRRIVGGSVDAIVGIAWLDELEKAIDNVLLTGIPCMAVPLSSAPCHPPLVDEDWVSEMIHLHQGPPTAITRTYVHLMRAAHGICLPAELERLAPRSRGGLRVSEVNGTRLEALDPVAVTEAVAYDFLSKGGKHSRPFVTVATYDALRGGHCTGIHGAEHAAKLPDAVLRTALAIETFHKASLVHDDIEDDDAYRYGEPTVHRALGVPTAINIGDYLIGMGYRLVSRAANDMGPSVAADILGRFADAHLRLSEGQGAELTWRDARDKRLSSVNALRIYALKTAPAFEAAMYAGARLAGPVDAYDQPIKKLAKNIGIAFQILNDLKDWTRDHDNKLVSGCDVVGGRPTVLLALALEGLDRCDQDELLRIAGASDDPRRAIHRVRFLYRKANVFEKSQLLVDNYQAQAEATASEFRSEELRRLCHYFIETILERPAVAPTDCLLPIESPPPLASADRSDTSGGPEFSTRF